MVFLMTEKSQAGQNQCNWVISKALWMKDRLLNIDQEVWNLPIRKSKFNSYELLPQYDNNTDVNINTNTE